MTTRLTETALRRRDCDPALFTGFHWRTEPYLTCCCGAQAIRGTLSHLHCRHCDRVWAVDPPVVIDAPTDKDSAARDERIELELDAALLELQAARTPARRRAVYTRMLALKQQLSAARLEALERQVQYRVFGAGAG